MKIEIDLNEILQDEYGPTENLAESIRRQIIESISGEIKTDIKKRISDETGRVINEVLQTQLRDRMPALIEEVMTQEYTPVDRFGSRDGPTTFKAQLLKTVTGEMVYRKAQYESERNSFTKAVDAVIAENMKKFQAEFNALVKDTFAKDALAYAVTELKKRLGI